MNPYGAASFFSADSGGFLFDDAYAPTEIATVLGPCASVSGSARISVGSQLIVPEDEFTRFLINARGLDSTNYCHGVLDLPRTELVRMEAPDNVACLYEMDGADPGARVRAGFTTLR